MTTNSVETDLAVVTPGAEVTQTPRNTGEEVEYPYVLRGVDPRELIQEGNTRVVGDIRETRPDLVASIAEHGVDPKISIINVVRYADGDIVVLVGFHRTAAAVAVKERENPDLEIVVLVHPPGTTRREVLLAQGIENIHREGYTQAEEASLYKQLAITGLDDAEISRQLTRPVERVTAGRTIAANPRTHAASEAMPGTDLLDLFLLAEFAENESDHQHLVEILAARPHRLEDEMARIRQRRAMEATQADEEQRLAAQGYGIVENQFHPPVAAARLEDLCAEDDHAPLTAAVHVACPGRAVAVDVDDDLEIECVEFCLDYDKHGHRTILSVRVAAAEAQLRADGVPMVDPDTDGLVTLHDVFADGQAQRTMTADEHAGCPGHAAYVSEDFYDSTAEVVPVCTDPAAHGHHVRGVRAAKPEPSAAFKKAEYDRTRRNNEAWRKSKSARRKWLEKFFTGWRTWKAPDPRKQKGKTTAQKQMLPPRVHHLLTLAPVLAPDFLEESYPAHLYACQLLKFDMPAGNKRDANPIAEYLRKKTTTETQAHLIRLAQVIGACEQHWDYGYTDTADGSWRQPSDDARFYFELLDALGYELTHVEKLFNHPELDYEVWPHLAPDQLALKAEPSDQTPTKSSDVNEAVDESATESAEESADPNSTTAAA